MTTLHIEHPITDLATWRGAFDRFAERRRQGGVCGERLQRPVDDGHYVLVDLDKQYTATKPADPWPRYYARELVGRFG